MLIHAEIRRIPLAHEAVVERTLLLDNHRLQRERKCIAIALERQVLPHLAFRGPVVDWQIWIADGDKPLPRKYVITTRGDPAQPQYMVLMSNWNVAPKVSDAMFRFTPPQGAKKTDFLRLDTGDTSVR